MKRNGGFDHNIQTVRIVTLLENRYYNFKGLNLSIETLDGLVKHNGPVKNKIKYNKILGKNFFKQKINFNNSPSLEAQIASISDDIAYNSHDLEDGLKANLFKLNDIKRIPILNVLLKKHINKIKKYPHDIVLRQIVREIIDEMVRDVIFNTQKNIKKNRIKSVKDIYKSKYPLVCFSNKMKKFDTNIKKFLKKNMYYNKNVIHKTNLGKKIVKKLFFIIKKNPKKYIKFDKSNNADIERSICDFIAGMTDRYAINLYNKIK